MSDHNSPTKLLGVYLVVLSVYQIGLYLSPRREQLALFDPRIAVSYFSEELFSLNPRVGDIVEWATAAWLLCLGVAIFAGRPLVKVYVISELPFGAMTALFLTFMAFGGHAVPGGLQLTGAVALFVVFTCVPIFFAIRRALANRSR
jgi:hypothetical protein